jgi:hypothetical protein
MLRQSKRTTILELHAQGVSKCEMARVLEHLPFNGVEDPALKLGAGTDRKGLYVAISTATTSENQPQ